MSNSDPNMTVLAQRANSLLDEDLRSEFLVWRLVLDEVATLEELDTYWTIDDLRRANALLDMRAWVQQEEMRRGRLK